MNMESIRECIRREPFVIRLSNGESHAVRHPECVAISRTSVVVTYPEEDRVVHCGLVQISAVESLQQA